MGFCKAIIALFCIAILAAETGHMIDSNEVFIGFCMVIAGFVAYSEK